MTDIPIPSGLTFKQVVDRAWLGISVGDAMFGRTEEEYASSILLLIGMMGQWPFDQLGFDDADPVPAERCGIETKWLDAVGLSLAAQIAPAIGKEMSPTARRSQQNAYSRLCSVIGAAGIPTMDFANGTATGSGGLNGILEGPFFPGVE